MQPIKLCNTYHAVLSSRELWRGGDGKSAFKVYFCDIIGRKEPARTVWAQCGMTKADFLARLSAPIHEFSDESAPSLGARAGGLRGPARAPAGVTAEQGDKAEPCTAPQGRSPSGSAPGRTGNNTSPNLRTGALGGVESAAGIGFITAFPHITKVFRFGPEVETNCHVRAWSTRDMKPLDLARGEGYAEFGCFAEAAIAAEEFAHWAAATSVEEYLGRWAVSANWPVARNDKLMAYWTAK